MSKDQIGQDVANGMYYKLFDFAVAINHKLSEVKAFPERLVVRAHCLVEKEVRRWIFFKKNIQVKCTVTLQEIHLSKAEVMGEVTAVHFYLQFDPSFDAIELGYISDEDPTQTFVTITGLMTPDFNLVCYEKVNPGNEAKPQKGRMTVPTCHKAPGKWAVAHEFAYSNFHPVICIWRFETPAHFEMHSHIQSTHCATFPSAWLQVWDRISLYTKGVIFPVGLKPGYNVQDFLGKLPIVLGEGGVIGAKPTSVIAEKCYQQFLDADFSRVMRFQKKNADLVACLMPMDLEYMHFNGYYGTPIIREKYCVEFLTNRTSLVMWYSWNAKWGFLSNNTPEIISDTDSGVITTLPPLYKDPPPSEHGEVWSYMKEKDRTKFEPYKEEMETYAGLLKRQWAKEINAPDVRLLPFFKFDPRRFTPQALRQTTGDHFALQKALKEPVQAGGSNYVGFKIYTPTGWSPMDPLLRSQVQPLWEAAIAFDVPLVNHGGPAGFYTQDREHYYDLLDEMGLIVDGRENEESDGWTTKFSREVQGADGEWFVPQDLPSKKWWFVQHYLAPSAWKNLVDRPAYKKLKICIAHFGDGDHFADNKEEFRATREPSPVSKDLNFDFNQDGICVSRTHKFVLDLLDLVDVDNRVYIDLSYLILTENNKTAFLKVFEWAREKKPILLERILWGTDWPLPAGEKPVKGKDGTMFYRYARGFREMIPEMPGDFFLRACFLNPLQFLNLKSLKAKINDPNWDSTWQWIDDFDPQMYDGNFTGDKLELLYATNKKLAKKMNG
ncbi:MAG: amidohydrolase family protein [Fibrobacterota bacterium]|nr:amidohydrolase family protein [Fibrobacterota bacterium]QQS06396.1 MAG: amidohydrolase family protein [Fibrobacterota bacterium]